MAASDRIPTPCHLPPEILQEIFVCCSHIDKNDEGYNVPDAKKAPLSLSYVCKLWRHLALGTPELWCRLYLHWTVRKRWSPSLIGQLWLSRCEFIPIHLFIYEQGDVDLQFESTGTSFAFGYAARLSSLSLHHMRLVSVPSGLDKPRFPLLRHLELREWAPVTMAFLANSVQVPQLSSYRLDQLVYQGCLEESFNGTSSLSCPITHLDIHKFYIEEDDLDMAMNMFPLLSALRVTIVLKPYVGSQPRRQTVFSKLRRMKLTLTDGVNMVDEDGNPVLPSLVFNRLSTPSLIALETNYDGQPIRHDNYYLAKEIYEFIQRSQCSLQELSISGWEYDDSLNGTRILELASSIPTLRKLVYDGVLDSPGYCMQSSSIHHLHDPAVDHPLVRVKDGEWEFLPLLEELCCHIDAEDPSLNQYDWEERRLPESITVIHRRMKDSSNRLKHCQVTVATRQPSGVSKIISDALISLTKLGLTFTINNLTLPKGNIAVSWDAPQAQQYSKFIDEERWAAYPGPPVEVIQWPCSKMR